MKKNQIVEFVVLKVSCLSHICVRKMKLNYLEREVEKIKHDLEASGDLVKEPQQRSWKDWVFDSVAPCLLTMCFYIGIFALFVGLVIFTEGFRYGFWMLAEAYVARWNEMFPVQPAPEQPSCATVETHARRSPFLCMLFFNFSPLCLIL
jgi:hypothetical protein